MLLAGCGQRENAGSWAWCESAPNRDPGQKRYNAFISLAKFVRRGVPIGADRNPLNRPLLPLISMVWPRNWVGSHLGADSRIRL